MFRKKEQRNVYKRNQGTLRRSPLYTMHARAAEKRSESLHKAGAIILLLAALGGVAWVFIAGTGRINQWLFVENEQFIIRTLDVKTTGRLSDEHIREFGGFALGDNLFSVDIASIRAKLEAGPLVKSAEVQRRLPDTLVVRVSERMPLARIAHGQAGFFFTIDEDGHVLGLANRQAAAMPVVSGFSDRGLTPGSVLRDGGAIDALNVIRMCGDGPISQVIKIQTIDVSNPDYLSCALEGDIKVLLPRNAPRSKLEELVVFLREDRGRHRFFDLTLDRNVPAT